MEFNSRYSKKPRQFWFCFLPSVVWDNDFLKNRFLPKPENGEVYSYRLPHTSTSISPDPRETARIINTAYNNAESIISNQDIPSSQLSILGTSLANAPAFMISNKFEAHNLVSITPEANLPWCIEHSIATQGVNDRGIKLGFSKDDFNKHLSPYIPINNTSNLPIGSIEIHLSLWDLVIPFRDANKLVQKLNSLGKKPKVRRNLLSGHALTLTCYKNKYQNINTPSPKH